MFTRSSRKEQTRERIVRTAARAVREHGYDGIGVADIMKRAGLTHGGFYAHFASKDALLAEAVARAGAETLDALMGAAGGENGLAAFIGAYLSPAHVKHVEAGCPIAALGSDAPRQAEEVKHALSVRVEALVDAVESLLPVSRAGADRRQDALAIAATLVGALVLARVADRPLFSRQILAAAKAQLAGE